jgi:hypothetical protein
VGPEALGELAVLELEAELVAVLGFEAEGFSNELTTAFPNPMDTKSWALGPEAANVLGSIPGGMGEINCFALFASPEGSPLD